MRSSPDAIVLMTVFEAFLIFVDDTKPVFIGFPLVLYGYQTVTADLYLHAFPGGYPGIELLKFLGGIIENRLTLGGMWSPASKFCFC